MATPSTPVPSSSPLPAVSAGFSQVVSALGAVNVAIPVIVSVVTSIMGIVKALRGTAPPLADIIAQIEQTVAANSARGAAEIARLREEQAKQGAGR